MNTIKIGTCGYSYFPEKGDKLLNYVKAGFPVVEINSSFYKIPRESTASKWREKADSLNRSFEFVVKAYKGITHLDKFSSKKSFDYFEDIKAIASALRSKIILFQSPASFKPTAENIMKAKKFFSEIERENFLIAWEVRWNNWKNEIIKKLFPELSLIHALDPLRRKPVLKDFCYFRIHGFGEGMMYNYSFNDEEIFEIISTAKPCNTAYIFFNNFSMYDDALKAIEIFNTQF